MLISLFTVCCYCGLHCNIVKLVLLAEFACSQCTCDSCVSSYNTCELCTARVRMYYEVSVTAASLIRATYCCDVVLTAAVMLMKH
jgi:hypothetical protein